VNENDYAAYLTPPASGFAGTSANVGGGIVAWGSAATAPGAPAYTTATATNFASGAVLDISADVTLGTAVSPRRSSSARCA